MRWTSLIIAVLVTGVVYSQVQDPGSDPASGTESDSTVGTVEQPSFFKRFKENWQDPYPNPLRAAMFSLVIPGSGQIYNKRYWKAPLVWGGLVGVGYLINHNLEQRDRFEKAYGQRVAGIPDEFEGIIPNAEGIKRYRDLYEKWLQQSYIGFAAVWILNSLEAYVDAHLKNFDISDDLSFQVVPASSTGVGGTNTGISILLHF